MKYPGQNHMTRIAQRMVEDVKGYSSEERTTYLVAMRALEIVCASPLVDVTKVFQQASKEVDYFISALHKHQRHGIG